MADLDDEIAETRGEQIDIEKGRRQERERILKIIIELSKESGDWYIDGRELSAEIEKEGMK